MGSSACAGVPAGCGPLDMVGASLLLVALRGRGFKLWVEKQATGIVPRLAPANSLTSDDKAAIAAHRPALLILLTEESPFYARTRFRWADQPAGSKDFGSYDWTDEEMKGTGCDA